MPDIVIGSGPAGVAAASALLERGREVELLDGGRILEEEAVRRRDALGGRPPESWTRAERAAYQAPQLHSPPGHVRRFGSDFAMHAPELTFAAAEGVALRSSRAAGGLSNLWGAAVLPYSQSDLDGWPITAGELAPHYRAVARIMPLAAAPDALTPLFPAAPAEGAGPPVLSAQARALLRRLEAAGPALARRGIHVGAARQAVGPDCRSCGMCLHGCPYAQIYSASHTLARLRQDPRFGYRPGAVVSRLVEQADGVELVLEGGGCLAGDRVFLGAGVLETARIMLASTGRGGRLTLRDSRFGFLPMVPLWTAGPLPDPPSAPTLVQVFIEIDDPALSPHLVHVQVYGWNEFYLPELEKRFARAAPVPGARRLLDLVSRRLFVAQIFLHSDHSDRISLALSADGRLVARPEADADGPGVLRAASARLAAAMRRVRVVTAPALLRPAPPGSSFHAGGTFPMGVSPDSAADPLGRPAGFRRVHLIDASVFPTIPATTITFSVMANAHRIAARAPLP